MFSMQYFSGIGLRTTIAACATIALLESSPSRAMSLVDGDHDMCRTSIDWDARIEACTRIIREGDNSPYRLSSVYTGRAFGYLNKGNFDRSIEDCNEGIRLGSYQPYAYEARGAVYFARGDFASAIADFDKAIERSPREGRAYFGGGIAHFYAGNWTKALAYLDRAHELSPLYSMYALWRDIVAGAQQRFERVDTKSRPQVALADHSNVPRSNDSGRGSGHAQYSWCNRHR